MEKLCWSDNKVNSWQIWHFCISVTQRKCVNIKTAWLVLCITYRVDQTYLTQCLFHSINALYMFTSKQLNTGSYLLNNIRGKFVSRFLYFFHCPYIKSIIQTTLIVYLSKYQLYWVIQVYIDIALLHLSILVMTRYQCVEMKIN